MYSQRENALNTHKPTRCGHICPSPHTQHGGVQQVKMAAAFKTICVGPWKSIIAECTTANLLPTSVLNNLHTYRGNGGIQTLQHKQESTFWLNTRNTDACSLLSPYNVELGQRQALYDHHKPVRSVLKKCTCVHPLPHLNGEALPTTRPPTQGPAHLLGSPFALPPWVAAAAGYCPLPSKVTSLRLCTLPAV